MPPSSKPRQDGTEGSIHIGLHQLLEGKKTFHSRIICTFKKYLGKFKLHTFNFQSSFFHPRPWFHEVDGAWVPCTQPSCWGIRDVAHRDQYQLLFRNHWMIKSQKTKTLEKEKKIIYLLEGHCWCITNLQGRLYIVLPVNYHRISNSVEAPDLFIYDRHQCRFPEYSLQQLIKNTTRQPSM